MKSDRKRSIILTMKQNRFYAAFAFAVTALFCNACGEQTEKSNIDNQAAAIEEVPNDVAESFPATPHTADKTGSSSEKTPEITEDTTNRTYQVAIDWQADETQDTAEDGTVLFISSLYYPVVYIEGNEEAAAKINADIQDRLILFQQDTSVRDFARENYVPENSGFISYSRDFTFASRRADSNVISFEAVFYSYSGGAHGNYTSIGINYSTQTGELIDFKELGENADSFRTDTFAYNRALADTKPYQNKMYKRPSDEALESVLYADDKWFLSAEGLTFISDTYALGPYAGGAIDFTIPCQKLEQMGLKEEYRYTGHLTMRLQDSLPVSMDLNGDGTEETILSDTVYDGSPDAKNEFTAYLLINDIDVIKYNEELEKLLHDFPWAQCVLYDLEPSDNMVEIAFITTEYIGEDDTPLFTSFFFRYDNTPDRKKITITYLGKTKGYLLEPGFEASPLLRPERPRVPTLLTLP